MIIVFVTFILLTTIGYGVLVWFCLRRVTAHLQDNPDATRAVVDHVLIPILGRRLVEASIENEAPKSNQKSL